MENYYPYIYDIVIALILIGAIIYGYCKGLLSMLTIIVGKIVAVVLALMLASGVSQYVYTQFIEEKVSDTVTTNIEEVITKEGEKTVNEIITTATKDMPQFIQKTALSVGEKVKFDTKDTENIANTVNEKIVSPIIITLVEVVVFLVLLAVFMIAVSLLIKIFDGVNEIPLVGKLNKILGAFAGAINGAIIIIIFVYLIKGAVILTGDNIDVLNSKTIEKSEIFSVLYEQESPMLKEGEKSETN